MPIPSTGPISFSQLRNEFNGTNPVIISDYYRNGGLVGGNNTNVPTSGTISISDFRGATNEFVVTLTAAGSPYLNVDVKAVVDAQDATAWASGIPISFVVESGVVIGSLNRSVAALTAPSGAAGGLSLDMRGNVYGAVGQNNSTPSTRGGNALALNGPVLLNNTGSIYGGGGGGNRGSNGSPGSCRECAGRADYINPPPGVCARNGQACIAIIGPVCQGWVFVGRNTPGGSGGAGGRGQGFSSSASLNFIQPPTSGSGGSGGTPCGPGGNFSGSGGSPGRTGSPGFPWGEGNGGTGITNRSNLQPGSVIGDVIGEETI